MKVVIIGGGPAGSLCAIRLKIEAKWAGRDIDVLLLEAKPFEKPGPSGCNFCAGVVTGRTVERLQEFGIEFPAGVVQRKIESFFYQTEGGGTEITKPGHRAIYSVFRGGGPAGIGVNAGSSFDQVLLNRAVELGAEVKRRYVVDVERVGREAMAVRSSDGSEERGDLVVAAFGVNSILSGKLQKVVGYSPPRSIRVCQAELALEDEQIDATFGDRIFAFAIRHPSVRFLAVTPKRGFVTITAVGDEAKMVDLREYLKHRLVAPYFPDGVVELAEACHCHPKMPIGMARGIVGDRFMAVGDACVTRYYKNGLGSALFTASAAAYAIAHGGARRSQTAPLFLPLVRGRFSLSNRCGKVIFFLNDITYKRRWPAAPTVEFLKREQAGAMKKRRLNDLMWSMFVGDRSYCRVLLDAIKPQLVFKLLFWDVYWLIRRIGRWIARSISGR
jgi:flavin-dependent dehydrogenase